MDSFLEGRTNLGSGCSLQGHNQPLNPLMPITLLKDKDRKNVPPGSHPRTPIGRDGAHVGSRRMLTGATTTDLPRQEGSSPSLELIMAFSHYQESAMTFV